MTIKEAFALLANNISAGMKNPFFIARKLHDSFVEIEENISGGGEPTVVDAYDVTYQQSNVGAALDYINQGVQYSTTKERIVGKWIDGKPIYMKCYTFETPLLVEYSGNWTLTGIDTSNIENIIRAFSVHNDGTSNGALLADPTRNNHTDLGLQTPRNGSQASTKTLILEYTKIS